MSDLEDVERAHKSGPAITRTVSKEEEIPEYTANSLWILTPTNPFRVTCNKIIQSKKFNKFIIFLILANCGFMAYDDPLDQDPNSQKNQILAVSETVFTILFTIEMVLKVIGMGFILDKGTYLRNGWNWLDFVVVCLGYLSLIPGVSNLSALRTFRVLRPLRTLSSIPGMRIIVKSMIASIPPLGGVALLSLFLFIIFGIVGLQLWGGVLTGRCFFNGTVSESDFCGLDDPNILSFGRECGSKIISNVTVVGLCQKFENPMYGLQSFDNIGFACLAIFTSITLEGWADLMYFLNDAFGMPYIVVTYFILLVMFGSYFLLNLTMAVIDDEYSKADAEQDAKDAIEKARQDQLAEEAAAAAAAAGTTVEPEEFHYCLDTPIVRACHTLVENNTFTMIVTGLIIGNTLCLSLEHYGMSTEFEFGLEIANLIFTFVFTMEMVLKLIGLGPRCYVKDAFNTFDGFVVTISLVETALAYLGPPGGGSSGLSALRTFRLMRVFKLARSWKNLRILLNTIIVSIIDVANASFLLAVIMFIFTLLGMQLFGGKMTPEQYGGEQPMAHFDNLFWSFVTVFQVLTGENWNEVLYDGMHGAGIGVSVFYFVSLNIVGNYVILNLFLAILLRNFEDGDDDDEEEEDGATPAGALPDGDGKYKVGGGAAVVPILNGPDAGGGGAIAPPPAAEGGDKDANKNSVNDVIVDQPTRLVGRSLGVMGPDNCFRVLCGRIIRFKHFDNFILVLIGISSVLLAIDEPYILDCAVLPSSDPGNCIVLKDVIGSLDLVISALFMAELVLKVIAFGFVMGETAYLRDGWNQLDFVIVMVSILSIAMSGQKGVKALRSLRALRALKPLRVIKRNPGMKLVVNSIFRSLPAIGNVTVVCLLFFLIFGIVGVQNWSGAFNSCNDASIKQMVNCTGFFMVSGDDCIMQPTLQLETECRRMGDAGMSFPRVWASQNGWSYDHVGMALLTLFEVTSGEMWPNIMYDNVAAVGKDLPMVRDHNQYVALYYIAVCIVCNFLMLNVFVGVVIDNYNKMKEEGSGSGLLTENQKVWVETMKLMMSTSPQRPMLEPKNAFRAAIFRKVQNSWFEMGIMGCIGLNTVVMSCKYYPQSTDYETMLENFNLAFTVVFALEFVVKIIGLGPRQYYRMGWNRFDFFLVVVSFVGFIGDLGKVANLLRIFRVARIFRLVKFSRRLLELFKTLVYSIPSLVNVGAILMLIFFMFAVMGMNLFAPIKLGPIMTKDANFRTFWGSFLTLFRMSTGESYNGIMHDCMIQPPYCDPESNCGLPEFAPIYFCVFFILTNYMLLNLLIAIILDNFGDTVELANATITEEHIDLFREEWAKQDHNANQWIEATGLKKLIVGLEYPLGLKNVPGVRHDEPIEKQVRVVITELEIPVFDGQINFSDTLRKLAERAFRANHGQESMEIPIEIMRESLPDSPTGKDPKRTATTAAEEHAAMSIQAVHRGNKERAELKSKGIPVRTTTPPRTGAWEEAKGEVTSIEGQAAQPED